MSEWKAAVRRMARTGLVEAVPQSGHFRRAAGCFAVTKDEHRDRLIADRRPQNGREASVGVPRLPYAPRLRRLRLGRTLKCFVGKRDLSNAFFQFACDSSRYPLQFIGPRVPSSWFDCLEDESLDFNCDDPWHSADLYSSSEPTAAPVRFVHVAVRAVMMGDLNAVAVVQEAHSRLLLKAGVLHPNTMPSSRLASFQGPTLADIYIYI